MNKHAIKYMKKALSLAKKAQMEDEIPIGAIIVKDGIIISKAYNQRNKKRIATCHAEIIAIEKACRKIKDWRLDDCEMYITLEPCAMCAGAIVNSRIKKIYFGAYEKKSGAVISNFHILENSGLNHCTSYEGGICEEECSKMLVDFFQSKRK